MLVKSQRRTLGNKTQGEVIAKKQLQRVLFCFYPDLKIKIHAFRPILMFQVPRCLKSYLSSITHIIRALMEKHINKGPLELILA
jgi:hypothetical protein